ncbi:MAG: hypothetical protein ACOVOI_01015, partial [Hyphomicrobiales bacterium]
ETARARIDEIDARIDEINAIFDEGEEQEDVDFGKLEAEYEALDAERSDLNNPVRELPEEWRGEVGRFLVLTTRGEMVLEADYYSEKRLSFETDDQGNVTATAEEPAPTSGSRASGAPARPEAIAPGSEKPISARLFDELAVQRRNILSACLLGDPGLALDFAIFALADNRSYEGKGTSIKAGRPSDPATGEVPQSAAEGMLAEAEEGLDKAWQEQTSVAARFIAFRDLEDEAKAAWLAYAVALSLEAKKGYGSEYHPVHAVLGSMLAAMLTPLGLVMVGAAAFGAYIAVSSGLAEKALGWLQEKFAELKADAIQAWQGIGDALATGDIAAAARILWLALQMEWQKGVHAVTKVWNGVKTSMLQTWNDVVFGIARAWNDVWATVESGLVDAVAFMSGVLDAFY